jgi:hypothetical protein
LEQSAVAVLVKFIVTAMNTFLLVPLGHWLSDGQ